MNKKTKRVHDIFIRYLIIILIALPNLWIFYFVFTPLTTYPVYILLKQFLYVSLVGNLLVFKKHLIEIIPACVAGSAYYLLTILNLSIPKIKFKQRIKMLLFSFLILLILNILRISLLSLLFVYDSIWFDITHKIFWYFLSTVFVVGIWFTEVKVFRIKEIPFYEDVKFLYKHSFLKK